MAFCSECGNLYNITNQAPKLEEYSSDSIITDDATPSKKQKKISQEKKYQHSFPVYFTCMTCGNSVVIKPKTLILSKKSNELTKEYVSDDIKPDIRISLPILLHTRDYICPNKQCSSHPAPETRDAVMNRIGNSYRVQYTCSICKTVWSQGVLSNTV